MDKKTIPEKANEYSQQIADFSKQVLVYALAITQYKSMTNERTVLLDFMERQKDNFKRALRITAEKVFEFPDEYIFPPKENK